MKRIEICNRLLLCFFAVACVSCQTGRAIMAPGETPDDLSAAVEAIAESVTGQDLNDAEVKNLMRDLRSDDEARSAVEAITDSVGGDNIGRVKYSPLTGKRYSSHMEYDPETGVKLEYVD